MPLTSSIWHSFRHAFIVVLPGWLAGWLAMSCDLPMHRKNIFKAAYLYFNEPGVVI